MTANKKYRKWSTSDLRLMKSMNDKKDQDIAETLGTTRAAVQSARMRFNLIKDRSVCGFKKGYTPWNKKPDV